VDIASLVVEARRFEERLRRVKAALGDPGFEWYPYDTLSALGHLDKLLSGPHRGLLDGRGRLLDVGSQDGELAFFLESLGYQVDAIDHPAYNHNGMRGIRALKAALSSAVEIYEIDIDRPFILPRPSYELVIFLGVLYHVRNPFYVLGELARSTTHCLLSTRVARRYPDGAPMPAGVALAYLLGEDELNRDDSNYFIFSEAGLRVMLERTLWQVVDSLSLGDTLLSDPVHAGRDERTFCLLRSRFDRFADVDLLDGWYPAEEAGWRWTEREFAVRLPGRARRLRMKLYLAESTLGRLGPVTLHAAAGGRDLPPVTYASAGFATYTAAIAGPAEVRFRLDKALAPEGPEERELGMIVAEIVVE
jgi:hypothetical protein